MAIYNTDSDSANTAVRAFLTRVGEYFLGSSFNTGQGPGRAIWLEIRTTIFESKCAYCGREGEALQIEHLIPLNREDCGLHHPGNVVPCCKECNKRARKESGRYCDWEQHLITRCNAFDAIGKLDERKDRINQHLHAGKYKYPDLTDDEKKAIRVIANSLYSNIKTEIQKSRDLYEELHKAFIRRITM